MTEFVYGFDAKSIDHLAQLISTALGIDLYPQQSPMIGPWYCSQDLSILFKQLNEGGIEKLRIMDDQINQGPGYQLVLNDPDPYYGGPEFPGGERYLLRIDARPEYIEELEKKLRDSGLSFRRLK